MATIKLKKPTGTGRAPPPRERGPVRGAAAKKVRPTLAEAQARRDAYARSSEPEAPRRDPRHERPPEPQGHDRPDPRRFVNDPGRDPFAARGERPRDATAPRSDPRREAIDPRHDPRQRDSRHGPQRDSRHDPQRDPRHDPQRDPRQDPQRDPRGERPRDLPAQRREPPRDAPPTLADRPGEATPGERPRQAYAPRSEPSSDAPRYRGDRPRDGSLPQTDRRRDTFGPRDEQPRDLPPYGDRSRMAPAPQGRGPRDPRDLPRGGARGPAYDQRHPDGRAPPGRSAAFDNGPPAGDRQRRPWPAGDRPPFPADEAPRRRYQNSEPPAPFDARQNRSEQPSPAQRFERPRPDARSTDRPRPPGRPGAGPPHRSPDRPAARPPGRPPFDDDDDLPAEHAPGSVRLSKRMSELGMASRREADEWISKGYVRVDDQVVATLGSRVLPEQRITIDAKARFQQAQRVTVLVNKPVGYVSGQAEDGYEPAVVLVTPANQWHDDRSGTRFAPAHLKNLVPAGRLDIDSVGLLVLTQDGRIAKQLIGEESAVDKEYLVRVAMPDGQRLPDADLERLRHGLELDGEALRPAQVEWLNEDQLRFVLLQGKKRQIRRMCEAVGLQVLGLKRVRVGKVGLGDLPPGQWRYLRRDESFE